MRKMMTYILFSLLIGGIGGIISYYACDAFAWEHPHLQLMEAAIGFFGAAIIATMIGCTCLICLVIRHYATKRD